MTETNCLIVPSEKKRRKVEIYSHHQLQGRRFVIFLQ